LTTPGHNDQVSRYPARVQLDRAGPRTRLAEGPATPTVANVAFWPLEPKGPLRIVAADMVAGLVLEADPNRPELGLRRLATRVPKPAAKVDDRLSILPHGHRSAQFAEFLEILLEQRFQSPKELAAFQLHWRNL